MMQLYVRFSDSAANKRRVWKHRPASPSEVVEAARQYVDYEAAKRRFDEVYYGAPNNIELVIHETVNAALGLGIEGEEGT